MQLRSSRAGHAVGPRLTVLALCGLTTLACSGVASSNSLSAASALETAPEALAPSAEAAADSPTTAAPEEKSRALPTECKSVDGLCLPSRDFVRRLCQGAFTGVAFHLLEKRSPFSRGYIRVREVQAVNALGGPSSDAKLLFGEEVLILTRTSDGASGQMQVSGMGGYDVLRWDGTCANLADGELAMQPPIKPHAAPLEWRYIDENIQEALMRDETIHEARQAQRKHCHGVTLGTRSAACVKADDQLNDRIILTLRGGLELPPPASLP
ncbi:MAG: hypothetical protein RL685_1261 [Pseudomonadota bacterium]